MLVTSSKAERLAGQTTVAREDREDPGSHKGPLPHRKFAIFIDYLNLVRNVKAPADLRNLGGFIRSFKEKGRILWIYAFMSENSASTAPFNTLYDLFQIYNVVCPREIGRGIMKEKDTVDFHMDRLIRSIVEHTDVTDIVIVSGDSDFGPVSVWARNQGMEVHMISARSALSRIFTEIEGIKVSEI